MFLLDKYSRIAKLPQQAILSTVKHSGSCHATAVTGAKDFADLRKFELDKGFVLQFAGLKSFRLQIRGKDARKRRVVLCS